jgi:hypothetical protein
MKIKNYTSAVPVERTVSRIEQMLATAGVARVAKDYKDGQLAALQFEMPLPTGRQIMIRLPVDHAAVYRLLQKQFPRCRDEAKLKAQAFRTSWKLMQEWLDIQFTLIHMQQLEPLQVFLPYVWDGKQTYYQHICGQNYNLLPEQT